MSLHQILLQPTDVLFFRDGRPMSGSLTGHSAAWPLPDVTNHALHAALHRADLDRDGRPLHAHRSGRSGRYAETRDRRFGSLRTTGPFPVRNQSQWFFPRPKDTQTAGDVTVTHLPVSSLPGAPEFNPWRDSSLPAPLKYAVAGTQPSSKESGGEPWISTSAFEAYLQGGVHLSPDRPSDHFLRDSDLASTESTLGIRLDPATGTTGRDDAKGGIYSAHYLRLQEGFQIGLFAEAPDKGDGTNPLNRDLLDGLLPPPSRRIIVGGQQRTCTAERTPAPPSALPLPRGLHAPGAFVALPYGKIAVKWVLLTPALWPELAGTTRDGSPQNPHPGGWLPNWICPRSGQVLLRGGDTERRTGERRDAWRQRVRASPEAHSQLGARLVAAQVPKPIVVTGWALPNDTDRPIGGAKPTQLAVPAGAVYYFEVDSSDLAAALARALNWHGAVSGDAARDFREIRNRRSTLLGEKGFGLGVCGTWNFHSSASAS